MTRWHRLSSFFFWPGTLAFAVGVVVFFSIMVIYFSSKIYHLNILLIEWIDKVSGVQIEMTHLISIQSWLATLVGFIVAITGFFLNERLKNMHRKIAIQIAGESVLHAKKSLVDSITAYQRNKDDRSKQVLIDEISILRSSLSDFDLINSRFSTLRIRLEIGEFCRQIDSDDQKYFIRHKNALIREIAEFLVKIGLESKGKRT